MLSQNGSFNVKKSELLLGSVTFHSSKRHLNRYQMRNISFRNDVLPLKDILYRLALRITTNPEEAKDIVQDTLIKLWNRRESLGEIESIEGFSLTICRNMALDRVRLLKGKSNPLDSGYAEKADNASDPLEKATLKDRISIVRQLLDSLPEKQKSCMQLRDFEGKSYKEIAAVMGISEEQVKINIFRARQTVKKKIKEYDSYGL